MIKPILTSLCAVALLAAAPTQAQEVPPDTLDWRRYYPLAVGNAWEYHDAEAYGEQFRLTLLSDTVVGGQTYYQRRTDRAVAVTGPAGPDTLRSTAYDFVRYDTTGFVVSVPSLAADTVAVNPCSEEDPFERPLRLGFDAHVACPPGSWASELRVEGGYGSYAGMWGIPDVEGPAVAWKDFVWRPCSRHSSQM